MTQSVPNRCAAGWHATGMAVSAGSPLVLAEKSGRTSRQGCLMHSVLLLGHFGVVPLLRFLPDARWLA